MTIKRIIAASVIGAALGGCVATTEVMDKLMASQEPPSAAIRKAIVNAARDYLADPYSIRDVEISSVMVAGDTGLHVVCVKFCCDPCDVLQVRLESGPKEGPDHEAIEVYGRADHCRAA